MRTDRMRTISRHIRGNVVGYIALFFVFTGGAYALDGTNSVDSGDIINNEVRTPDVRDDTLANGGLQAEDLRADSVGSSEVAPESLDAVDLNAGSVGASEVADESLGSADLALASVGPAEVAENAISSDEVSLDGLGAVDLGPDSVGSSEVAADAIGSSELAPDAVSTTEILDGQVTHPDLGANSVTGGNVFPSSLSGADIQASSLTGSDIAAETLTGADLGPGAVGPSEVVDGSLGTAEFASSIPAVHVTRTVSQGIPNNSSTTLNFNSERYDTAGMHSNSSNTSRLTAPVAGIYAVNVSYVWDTQGAFPSGERAVILRRNGTIEVGTDQRDADTAPSGAVSVNLSTMLKLAAGDFLEARVFQDSGGSRSVRALGGESSPEFSMTWLAPG